MVSFVDTRTSRLFRFPFICTVAIVFPLILIRLSFTSLYSVSAGFNGVVLLTCDFGLSIGEPLSFIHLIERLLTNAVKVKNSRPFFFIWRVKWIFDSRNRLCSVTNRPLPPYLFHVLVCCLLFCLFYSSSRSGRPFRILHISFAKPGICAVWTSWLLRSLVSRV